MKRVVTVVCLIILSLLINSSIEAQNLKSSRRSEKTQIPSVNTLRFKPFPTGRAFI
jgi:hypothetical protein